MCYNLFLPGGIGGYKVYLLRQRFPGKTTVLVRVLMLDRVSGVLALSMLMGVLFTFVPAVPLPWRRACRWAWRPATGPAAGFFPSSSRCLGARNG